MASSSVCASTTCVVECSTSVLKKRLIGLRFTPDLGVCLNVYQDRVGKSQLLVLYNVIINYSIRFYPFSNPAVPLKFRVGPLFRMFSFQTVPWMTCHRIGCRVSFFHNQESPRHTHTLVAICNLSFFESERMIDIRMKLFFFRGNDLKSFQGFWATSRPICCSGNPIDHTLGRAPHFSGQRLILVRWCAIGQVRKCCCGWMWQPWWQGWSLR